MAVRISRFWVVYHSISMTVIDPLYLGIKEEDVKKYIQTHPKPEDPEYTSEELIEDLTNSSGFYCIPDGASEETRDYVVEILDALIK